MGGKKNQAQRTKNNVKPSSSSRSADLLGKDATELVGFLSLKQNMFAGKTEQQVAAEDFDNIDPNFQVSLKKLNKKYAVTKRKGLQELTELFISSEEVTCKTLLPYWCQVYCTLSVDIDNKVRENVQIAHQALSSRVGRNLAPYIRNIAPVWFVSQFDTYPPAASSATAAFKATFPDNKVKDVLSFCHDEIFSFIYDHLIIHTAQSLSKPDMSKEDTEAKYERLIICSLNGYSHFVEILSTGLSNEANDKFIDLNKKLLSSNKFWEFASHKTSLIRAAWYATLISLCKSCLQFVKDEARHLVKSVFSNLDEADPFVLPLVWESALYSLQIINDGSQQVNLEKVVFPKLCGILEKGGLGNAATIYPNLLPLLSNISASLTSDKHNFYLKFFQSLHSGLKQHPVKSSHSESKVIVNTYMECFRYVLMLHNEDNQFCLQLIEEQLVGLLKDINSDASQRATVVPLYFGIVDLVSYWQRSVSTYPSYAEFLSWFWKLLGSMFVTSFNSSTCDLTLASHIFYCQHKFFETFLRPVCRNKKNLKVKFDSDDTSPEPEPELIEESLSELNINSDLKSNLETLGGELLKAYYSSTDSQVSDEFKNSCICQLSLIVKLLGFEFFLSSCELECSKFCVKLQNWLKDDKVPVEPILVLTFTALASITEENIKKTLLEDLIQVRPEMLIKEAIKLCMTGKAEYSQISSWLKNENVRSVLISFADGINEDNSDKTSQVLKLCLTSSKSKEYIVGDETVAELLKRLGSKIEMADLPEITLIQSVLEDVFKEDTSTFFKNHHRSVFTLLKSLISKSFSQSDSSLMRIVGKGISCCSMTLNIDRGEFKRFISDCGALICKNFEKRINKNGMSGLVNMVNVSSNLLKSLASCKSHNIDQKELSTNLANELLSIILTIAKQKWQKSIEDITLTALAVDGDITFCDFVQNSFIFKEGIWNPLKDVDISSYSQTVLFALKMIFRILGEECSGGSFNVIDDGLITNQDLNKLDLHILDLTYALVLMRTVSKYYSSTQQYFDSLEYIEPLAPGLKELVQRLDEASYPALFDKLQERVNYPNTMWAQVDEIIRVEFLESETTEVENVNERILTSTLEESSLRSLRSKLKSKKKGLENFINFICWKFDTTNKAEATAVYNVSVNNVGVSELCLSSEIARYLTELIKYNDTIIETKTWNFIMNSIAAWAQSLDKTLHPKYCKEYVGFVVSFCKLFITFSAYLESDLSTDEVKTHVKEERNKYIRKNWEIFTNDVNSSVYNSWKKFAEQCSKHEMEPLSLLLIESLSNAVCHIAQSGKLTFKQNYELISLTKSCSDLLLSSCPAVQITSYLTLQSVVVHLAKLDSNLDENSADKISCLLLKDTLFKTQTVVEAMLQDFKLGVMCLVAPYTDSYIYTRANLMAWLVLLDIFKAADSRIRHLYTCWMKEQMILNHLMDCLLHLLPNLVVIASDSTKKIQDIFSTTPSFSYSGWTSGKLSALSSFVYIHVLRILPLLSRIWYSESEPKKRDFTDKFTVPYVSPLLINEEINFALNETKKCDNLSLKTLPTARLVNAIFTVEDSKTELGIQLAHNHPFTPPKVDTSKSVVSSSQTKQKLKQLTLFPTLQNGSLWDCIIVWKNYLDKKFEGVEECYICYSVLHYGTHQLPKLTCRTCKKKFHSACLYKWFTSSNKSTCPICRNLF